MFSLSIIAQNQRRRKRARRVIHRPRSSIDRGLDRPSRAWPSCRDRLAPFRHDARAAPSETAGEANHRAPPSAIRGQSFGQATQSAPQAPTLRLPKRANRCARRHHCHQGPALFFRLLMESTSLTLLQLRRRPQELSRLAENDHGQPQSRPATQESHPSSGGARVRFFRHNRANECCPGFGAEAPLRVMAEELVFTDQPLVVGA